MRLSFLITLMLFSISARSQDLLMETNALNFYIDSIFNGHDKIKSTGEIHFDEYDSRDIRVVYPEFLNCKRNVISSYEQEIPFAKEMDDLLDGKIGFEVDTIAIKDLNLRIELPLIEVKKCRFQNLKGGVLGLLRDFGDSMFGERFYLLVYRCVKAGENNYVLLSFIKKDNEFQRDYFIKLDSNANVVDWCKRTIMY